MVAKYCVMAGKYYKEDVNNIRFVFSYDPQAPDLLHIFVRHMMEPGDAIDTFFDGQTVWNKDYKRFETSTADTTLYWFWLKENVAVMVISCFSIK
jgi:hypothetical protein